MCKNKDVNTRLMNRKSFVSFGLKNSKLNFCFVLVRINDSIPSLIFSLEIGNSFFVENTRPQLEHIKFSAVFILPHLGQLTSFSMEVPVIILFFLFKLISQSRTYGTTIDRGVQNLLQLRKTAPSFERFDTKPSC